MTDNTSPSTTVYAASAVRCRICGRFLRNPKWHDIRIGPVCRRKSPESVKKAEQALAEANGQQVIPGEPGTQV